MHKKKILLMTTLISAMTFGVTLWLFAHGGEDHGVKLPALPKQERFVLNGTTENFELVVKFMPIAPGKESALALFVTDYTTNKPIKDAEIQIDFPDAPDLKAKVEAAEAAGAYRVVATFPEAKAYAAVVTINTPEVTDLIPLSDNIEVGKTLVTAEAAEHGHVSFWQIGGAALFSLVVGFSGYSVGRRNGIRWQERNGNSHAR